MCGITVVVDEHESNAVASCKAATAIIGHRGPDDSGIEVVASANGDDPYSVVLGHQRLAILDLSRDGHQPMKTPDERFTIVYNGEVFNYIEIRKLLQKEGVGFRSTSDTEVVLAAYACWGAACLDWLNGMFAFVVYDKLERTLFAARDRFGIKPLYYWNMPGGGFAICSEIKQLTVLPGWQASVNAQRAYDFLAWGFTDHTEQTFFSGVNQLRGGEYLQWDLDEGGLDRRRWYQLPQRRYSGTFQQATAACHHLLQQSVRLRLRSDVEVGSCLSGGLDSSSIVCLVSELLGGSTATRIQKTFTAASHERSVDEREHAEKIVGACGIEGHYCYPESSDLLDELAEVIWHQDEPFGTTSIYAQWCVFRSARAAGVKVMLDGQGADEQLGGYHSFFGSHCADLLKELRWIALRKELSAIGRLHGLSQTSRSMVRHLLPESARRYLRRSMPGLGAAKGLVDSARFGVDTRHPFDTSSSATFEGQRAEQLIFTNLPTLLRYEDRNSMAHSIEARTPFLDYRLVEFLMSLPGEYLIRGGMTKAVLREAMRGTLPEPIRMRVDKIGFATPEEVWMKREPAPFLQLARDAVEGADGFLDDSVVTFVNDVLEGKRPYTTMVWRLICLGLWMQRFEVRAQEMSQLQVH